MRVSGGRSLILVTNDDGIHSPGLHAAVAAACTFGDVLIAAPLSQQTGASRSYSSDSRSGRIFAVPGFETVATAGAYAIDGTPATVVSHALLELASQRPTLCVSGINYGENVGLSILASGTVGAAIEAHSYGVPAIAISLECPVEDHRSTDYRTKLWDPAVAILKRVLAVALSRGLPPHVAAWNVNIPLDATGSERILTVRQSGLPYYRFAIPERRLLTDPAPLTSMKSIPLPLVESDTDIAALVVHRLPSLCELRADLSPGAQFGHFDG
jgi:5'-nucleotidase